MIISFVQFTSWVLSSDKEISLVEAVQAYGVLANQGIISGQALENAEKSDGDVNLSPPRS